MKKPLIILTGPTAVGKTALSLKLAAQIGGEIISADSMQVYRHMDIGSAKILPQQMQGIRHHLIDILEPFEEFNVVIFQKLAKECIQEIYERGHIPILTGGTGFYIQALLYDIDFTENEDHSKYRKQLEELAVQQGNACLHHMLEETDAESAAIIHENNVKRVIRALEFYKMTGQKISAHNELESKKEAAYHFCYFVLNDDREKLYQRIDKRVDAMMKSGLQEEVRKLQESGCTKEMVSMQGLGYKEILQYFSGEINLEEAISQIKRGTRHFAKRQLTWFRREKEVTWVSMQDFEAADREYGVLAWMLHQLKENNLI